MNRRLPKFAAGIEIFGLDLARFRHKSDQLTPCVWRSSSRGLLYAIGVRLKSRSNDKRCVYEIVIKDIFARRKKRIISLTAGKGTMMSSP